MSHTLGESYAITVYLKVKDPITGEEKIFDLTNKNNRNSVSW